ncbi:hypothetical protein [Microvirga guangxiensis]|uniref:hypothetical protein n=1 Tax=Microvirga guangxiensis TaxID=549386 RepID=UPI0015871B15|nr:hypothetical protein [Microvirga guangxiensis]
MESARDNELPENSQENLDARLDHAIDETFPTSDPVSVVITKGPAPDHADLAARASSRDDQQSQSEQDTAEQLLDQVRDALHDVADQTAGAAQDAYNQGKRYVRQAGKHYPEAARYYQEGRQALHQRALENPWPFLLAASAVGYVLAWMIHSERRDRRHRVPDHGKTRTSYAPHEDTRFS